MCAMPRSAWRRASNLLAIALVLLPAGCSAPRPPARTVTLWLAGHPLPAFDPDGPRDALRVALERQLSRGLVDVDSAGRVEPVLADSIGCTQDSLTWTFRLRGDARFTDGTPVTSADIRAALVGGLGRADHATREWLLAAVKGIASPRKGGSAVAYGIETAGPSRLVLRLAVRDARLLEKLAVPGVSTPWKRRTGSWRDAVGAGPYRIAGADGDRMLTLAAATTRTGVRAAADTLRVRFLPGAIRVRNILRRSGADVVWPLPPGFLDAGLPEGWEVAAAPAVPGRRLLLVMRPDVPPLGKIEVRESLARAIRPAELALRSTGEPLVRWLPGASLAFAWPAQESATERGTRDEAERIRRVEARRELAQRSTNRHVPVGARPESYHVVLAFDADGAGANVATALQGQWAAAGDYAELRALRGDAALSEPLRAAGAQATLVVSQAPLPGLVPELAQLVQPLRGPVRGGFRSGWRTREFDRWLLPQGSTAVLDPDTVQQRLSAARIVYPIADLPWRVAFRTGAPRPRIDPRHGPDWTLPSNGVADARTR
jgi:ABC-type transport system substrate-binding protein